MNRKKAAIILYIVMAYASSGVFFSSCHGEIKKGSVIFTQIIDKTQDINTLKTNSWRYNLQSRIVSLDLSYTENNLKVLSENFYSALSPKISDDGKFLLFAGQKKQNDIWQIWEMDLKNTKIREITAEKENCIDPAYLPGGRVVFSKFITNVNVKSGLSLFTCNKDGTNLQKITFEPRSYYSSTVLKDGRILAISQQIFPEMKEFGYMVLRPDGTKASQFYSSLMDGFPISPVCETADGNMLFVEAEKTGNLSGNLISISYNRPMHSRENYSSELKGSFQSVTSLKSGKLLVSYRPSENEKYSLFEFDIDNKILGRALFLSTEFDAAEPVIAESYVRPKKLPSEVDMGVKTGLLLCQDINFHGVQSEENGFSKISADRIEIIGVDSTLGVVKAEKDGSVYLKVIADTPFRIRTLNEKGQVLNETCDWIYIRPNERRGCVGCHEDPEIAPENRLPLAVKNAPVIIPVHKSNLKEKTIELE